MSFLNLFNEKREEYIEFKPLEPWYRFHFHDNQTFDYSESIKKTEKEMKKFSIEDANNYDKLLEASKAIFDVGFTKLSDKPFSSFFYMMKQVPALIKLKSYLTVSQLVNKYIKNPNLKSSFFYTSIVSRRKSVFYYFYLCAYTFFRKKLGSLF